MKQSLNLRIGQQLTMTPQLQQAIHLLQLSSLDLQQEIQQALDSNVMLEIAENNQDEINEGMGEGSNDVTTRTEDAGRTDSADSGNDFDEASYPESPESSSVDFDNTQNNIPNDLPTDSQWDDVYEPTIQFQGVGAAGEDADLFENNGKTESSLKEHLLWQFELTPFSDTDKAIAEAIIDSTNADGYLGTTLEDIFESLRDELDIDFDEVEAVLHQLQNFDPPGVFARDLQDNLLIQLKHLPAETPWLKEASNLVARHLKLLASKDFTTLKRRMKLDESQLAQVIELIRSLNPRPGGQISDENPQYITPDVYVRKLNGKWVADLNPECTPDLRINEQYLRMVREARGANDMASIRDHLQEARWFIKSLQNRNETLLKVARSILEFQQDFFEHGDEHMKALVLADVAQSVDMHESTISRATTQKYMHTPRGIFELKYFFSSHVSTADGGEASATAIRAIIKKLISNEDSRKPLSDNKIAELLSKRNYKVARRTVAKYRESMTIPPSNERKSLA